MNAKNNWATVFSNRLPNPHSVNGEMRRNAEEYYSFHINIVNNNTSPRQFIFQNPAVLQYINTLNSVKSCARVEVI